MPSNNDSGGGGSLWLVDLIAGGIRNKNIEKYNQQARGIEEYQSLPVNILFPPHTFNENIIISGGSQNERLHICEGILRNAHNANHAVIILHVANNALENIVFQNGFGTVVNNKNRVFDAFTSFDFNDIVHTVMETCQSKYDIKPAGRYVLQVVYDLLLNRKRLPFFSAFANCPYFKLSDQIASRLSNGSITKNDSDRLNSLLMTGQIECPKIDTFFHDMKAQIDYLSASDPSSVNAVSILSAIKNNQILCVDMRSSANVMLMELIVNSLIIAMNRGYDFSLFIDDISFINNEMLKNTVSQKSNHRNIIVSKDLYMLTGGKEDIFASVIAEAEKTVLFSHSSNISCEKLSQYIGNYEKIDVSYNHNSGWYKSSRWGYNSHDGQTETKKRESRVKPEEINRLSQSEAIVYDHSTSSLIRTVIT